MSVIAYQPASATQVKSQRTCIWIAVLLLFATTVPVMAQTGCKKLQAAQPKTLLEQLKAFLSDERLGVAGSSLGLIGMANENPRIEAIADTIHIVHYIAKYLEKNPDRPITELEVCPTPPSVTAPLGYKSLPIIGTPSEIQAILRSAPQRSLDELLKPYRVEQKIPNFPVLKLRDLHLQSADLLPPPRSTQPTVSKEKQQTAVKNYRQHQAFLPSSPIPVMGTVAGKVLDEHGNPISGAVVSLADSLITARQPQSQMTRQDGSYYFADIPGSYFISARLGSSVRGGELDSGSQTVALETHSPSRLNLYLHPRTRTEIEEEVTPEQKRMVIDFIADADGAESEAGEAGDPRYLEYFYTGDALQYARDVFSNNRKRGEVSRLQSGRVQQIHYFPSNFTILVDTTEVWSRTVYDDAGREVRTYTTPESPQTITIQQTPQGWYISHIQFHRASSAAP